MTVIYDVLKIFKNFVLFTIIYDGKIVCRRRKFRYFTVENTNLPIENRIILHSNQQKSRLRRAKAFQNISEIIKSSKKNQNNIKYAAGGGEKNLLLYMMFLEISKILLILPLYMISYIIVRLCTEHQLSSNLHDQKYLQASAPRML